MLSATADNFSHPTSIGVQELEQSRQVFPKCAFYPIVGGQSTIMQRYHPISEVSPKFETDYIHSNFDALIEAEMPLVPNVEEEDAADDSGSYQKLPSDDYSTPRRGNQRNLLACLQFDRFLENQDDHRTGWWKNPTSSMQQSPLSPRRSHIE
jgi:hypothetical protein